MARPHLVLLLGLLGAGLSTSSIGRADPAGDAKDLFARGRNLRVAGDCARAVPLFRKALAVYPSGLGSLRNLAECEEALGRYASARRAWLDLSQALVLVDAARYAGWSKDAKDAAARLEPRVATLTIDLDARTREGQPAAAGDVQVTVDGEPLPPDLLGTTLERDPGRYVVRAEGARVAPTVERVVELLARDHDHVRLDVLVVEPTAAATGISEGLPADRSAPIDAARLAGWVALGVGAASLVGAGVSAVFFQSARDQVTAICPGFTCPSAEKTASISQSVQNGRTAALLVDVFAVVGGLGLAGGAVLFATSHREHPRTAVVLAPAGLFVRGEL
jgi:hypothetical protein